MKLSELASEIKGTCIGDAEILNLCTDSRVAGAGDLFFCFRGNSVDSHDFAEQAVLRGAAAIVCERKLPLSCPQLIVKDGREAMAFLSSAFYRHPERKLKIVGVTGTNGKTTTCHLIRSALTASGKKVGIIGTLGAHYANKAVPPDLTTPDPVALFSLLADMVKEGVEIVVMEVSAHALALHKVTPILFEIAVFTNLTRDHLDFFGDMKAYGEAKKQLFQPSRCRFAIYNADDAFTRELLTLETAHTTYGLDTPADAFALIQHEDLHGSEVLLNLNDELCEVELNLTGRYNAMNALAAACAAKALGATVEDIAEGFASLNAVDGRLEHVASFHGAEIFVDFAHTPDGLEKSLTCLREHCDGRLIALFGCGGNRDGGKRKIMGETAARHADFSIITSDNPRFEEPCEIIAEIERGYVAISSDYVAVEEREKAIELALKMLEEGDVLLVAGKGGETYQEIMGIKYDFNDKDVIKSIIGKLA